MTEMNLNNTVKIIEIFYDGQCGMCCTFIGWLDKQEHVFQVDCYDYHQAKAKLVFPDIGNYDPSKELVVRVDENDVYTGAEGWVYCLWGCAKYRNVACKMNNAILLPMAKKFCYLVSNNRLKISKLFFSKKTKEIADEIEAEEKKNKKI